MTTWTEIGFIAVSVSLYWAIVGWLLWSARRRAKTNQAFRLRTAIASCLVIAVIFPELAQPVFLIDYITQRLGVYVSPMFSRFLLQGALAFKRNLALVRHHDIRTMQIEYRFDVAGSEKVFKIETRCVSRDIIDTEWGKLMPFEGIRTAVGGELDQPLNDSGVTVHAYPSNMLCHNTANLPQGEQRSPAIRGGNFSAVYLLDGTRAPPAITTFNLTDAPLSAGGVTAYPPTITAISYTGAISFDELVRYAPPFRTQRDNGDSTPDAVEPYRIKYGRPHKPAELFQVNGWTRTR